MKVVIVESPAKAKTINKYLGPDFKVLASYGHVRDLPSKNGSVKPDDDFSMVWESDNKSKKRLNEIAIAVKSAEKLYLATDPDREGEAISWHVLQILKDKKVLDNVEVKRVAFNQITKSAVLKAMAEPREIDHRLVDAYLARRALDYLVGFTLSPLLWRKLPGSRSAGRVQSVALRIICNREREIETFDPQEYWQLTADLVSPEGEQFQARLTSFEGKRIQRKDIPDKHRADRALAALREGNFSITSIESKPTKRNPQPPFITSTLQQEAARKLGMSARQTMQTAQALYEGKSIDGETVGLITYMRTDGVTMAPEAVNQARKLISERYGPRFVPDVPRLYKSKVKNAQEAHEAIRPTNLSRHPKDIARALSSDEERLYDLIWKRTIASQMATAIIEKTTVEIANPEGSVGLRANGQVIQFEGFFKLYSEGRDDEKEEDERRLPKLNQGASLELKDSSASQHFTEPPPRYTEASLVKKLEELGIGRPSTFASTLSTLRDRNYVHMIRNRFHPEDKGQIVTAFLESFFGRYVEYDFTANLERQLDQISAGELGWKEALREFWGEFNAKVEEIADIRNSVILESLNDYLGHHLFHAEEEGADPRKCPDCGDEKQGRLSLKVGRYGAFIGCSNYPDCRFTRKLDGAKNANDQNGAADSIELGMDPETGEMVTRRTGRFGPYVQLGEGKDKEKPKRSTIPKDMEPEDVDMEQAMALLSLPRELGNHPETGKMIMAAIGRYGPYLAHDGAFGKLQSTEEVFSVGLNRAVTILAESKARKGGPQELRQLGDHPDDGETIRVMSGRYGPYVKHGKINATIPNGLDPDTISLEAALELIKTKQAKGSGKKRPAKKKRKKK